MKTNVTLKIEAELLREARVLAAEEGTSISALLATRLEQLWDSGQGVLSTQVLQELCINLRRKISHPLPVDEVRLLIRDYATWEVVTNTPESVLQALDIELRYKTSFWDALILQAAESSGSSILYSEDLATGQRYRAVRVMNPLIQPIGTQ